MSSRRSRLSVKPNIGPKGGRPGAGRPAAAARKSDPPKEPEPSQTKPNSSEACDVSSEAIKSTPGASAETKKSEPPKEPIATETAATSASSPAKPSPSKTPTRVKAPEVTKACLPPVPEKEISEPVVPPEASHENEKSVNQKTDDELAKNSNEIANEGEQQNKDVDKDDGANSKTPASNRRLSRRARFMPNLVRRQDKEKNEKETVTESNKDASAKPVKDTPTAKNVSRVVNAQKVAESVDSVEKAVESNKEKDSGGAGDAEKTVKEPEKTTSQVRRSRFPKVRPNLAEAGRPRVRHPSVGTSDSEDDPGRKHPTTGQRSGALCSRNSGQVVADANVVQEVTVSSESGGGGDKSGPSPFVPPPPAPNPQRTTDRRSSTRATHERDPDVVIPKRRKMEKGDKPPDRNKMKMGDLIYWNPKNNPMKYTLEEEKKKRRASVEKTPERAPSPTPSIHSLAAEETEKENLETCVEDEAELVPQVKIGPDGQIILNEESLVVDTSPAKAVVSSDNDVIHEHESFTTYASFKKRCSTKVWTEKETIRFYKALSTVGTDFSLMSNLFSKRSRAELKNKFKKEEKTNKNLVDKAIRDRQHFDMSLFDMSESESEPEKEPKKKRGRKRKGENNENISDGKKKQEKKKTRKKKGSAVPVESDEDEAVVVLEENASPTPPSAQVGDVAEGGDDSHATIAKPVSPHPSDDEEVNILENMQRPTRSGRTPKPANRLTMEEPVRKKINQILEAAARKKAEAERAGMMSPPHTAGSASPGLQFINLSSQASSIPQVNVSQLMPGELVFVSSKSPSKKPGGNQLIHVYMVSPSGALTAQAPPGAMPPGASLLRSPPGGSAGLSQLPPNSGGMQSLVSASGSAMRTPPTGGMIVAPPGGRMMTLPSSSVASSTQVRDGAAMQRTQSGYTTLNPPQPQQNNSIIRTVPNSDNSMYASPPGGSTIQSILERGRSIPQTQTSISNETPSGRNPPISLLSPSNLGAAFSPRGNAAISPTSLTGLSLLKSSRRILDQVYPEPNKDPTPEGCVPGDALPLGNVTAKEIFEQMEMETRAEEGSGPVGGSTDASGNPPLNLNRIASIAEAIQ